MFIDSVTISVKAGNGGNGAATFRRTGQTAKGGPDGGNGGNGGSIYIQGSSNVTDLREFRFKKKFKAEDGVAGRRKNLFGKNAPHLTILVPLGTQITNTDSGLVYEVNHPNPILLVVGGKGGRGNYEFRTATNQTPTYAEPGAVGELKNLFLDLRIIAEVGLIGLPNAGKSSLLAALTNAKPAIADYPFTTLEPNIGMLEKHPIADIPGLIEGASQGKGRGTKFLKHIEKTRILLHCIDVTNPDLHAAYTIVRRELKEFNPELALKPEIILLTKTDLVDSETTKQQVGLFKKQGYTVLTCSTIDTESITELKSYLKKLLTEAYEERIRQA